ncbi:MAG: UvrD-helicase domain-containing protein [Pseudomonadales bacterium]
MIHENQREEEISLDAAARERAIDPARSVIVEAPAGSGKTTLLVVRYLRLLAIVNAPEEILAITFTRKAAAEMRERVLRYLDPAFTSDAPHDQLPLELGRALRDRVAAWGVMDSPGRLAIRTIDSFNLFLTRSMPVASALGPAPEQTSFAQSLYRAAARRTLAHVEAANDDVAAAVALLLRWRDHRVDEIERLLVGLLAQREQWLPQLQNAEVLDRDSLERALDHVVRRRMTQHVPVLYDTLTDAGLDRAAFLEDLQRAAHSLAPGADPALARFREADQLPSAVPEDLPLWEGIGSLLLTKGGNLRKTVDARVGCPPKSPHKVRLTGVLTTLQESGGDTVEAVLKNILALPPTRYTPSEWEVLDALGILLRHAAAMLDVVFAESGRSDFAWVTQAALRALGHPADPTDLLLYLDRRIHHVLVDEFQDTNRAQLKLLERLTAGWQPGDGRTLFVVGDPMQSIYGFREADVGLFLHTRDMGIGDITLERARLTRNFRSRADIVDWVNERLGPLFPTREDESAGAVGYAASTPARTGGGHVALWAHTDPAAEADAISARVAEELAAHADNAEFRAAIIVRARSHLGALLPALDRLGVRYRAVKLDRLLDQPVVQDLLAITRALLLPGDRTPVLALLRSPYCGLSLAGLAALAAEGRDPQQADATKSLGEDERCRADRVLGLLAEARAARGRLPLRDRVEAVWQRLGGAAVSVDPVRTATDAESFFRVLADAEREGGEDWAALIERLEDERTEGGPVDPDVRLEILTLHAAKGLEWDLVVLPALERPTTNTGNDLLYWLPLSLDERETLLLAPLRAAGEDANQARLVRFIRGEHQKREGHEQLRLLYVAATRARERLILSGVLRQDANGISAPRAGSLLSDLWPTSHAEFEQAAERAHDQRAAASTLVDAAAETDSDSSDLRADLPLPQDVIRIASGWAPPATETFAWSPTRAADAGTIDIEFAWAGLEARRTGIVLHRLLEETARIGSERLSTAERDHLIDRVPLLLASRGAEGATLERGVIAVREAYLRTLASAQGQWLLRSDHAESACELRLSGIVDGAIVSGIIDRTFVTEEGERWIIDYKSGYHLGGDLDAFLAEESLRYQSQLRRYRALFAGLGATRIRTGLYLPRHDRLIKVD